jgi:K+-transporting ATPase KdpF subunit
VERKEGNNHVGILVRGIVSGLVPVDDRFDRLPGQNDGRGTVNIIYIVSWLVSVGLLGYLVAALLKPEWF